MDSPELGHALAMATHIRHALTEGGHNVMDPIVYAGQNPAFAIFLSRTLAECQKQGRLQDWFAKLVCRIVELSGLPAPVSRFRLQNASPFHRSDVLRPTASVDRSFQTGDAP